MKDLAYIVEIDYKRVLTPIIFNTKEEAFEYGKTNSAVQFVVISGKNCFTWEKSYRGEWAFSFNIPESEVKPPLGLTPKYIVEAKRLQEIREAIIRYCEARKEIPMEWVEEYNELVGRSEKDV
jgi:hypothetical protein